MPTSRLEPPDCDETHTDDDNLEDRVDDNGSPPPPHYCLLSRGVKEISRMFTIIHRKPLLPFYRAAPVLTLPVWQLSVVTTRVPDTLYTTQLW